MFKRTTRFELLVIGALSMLPMHLACFPAGAQEPISSIGVGDAQLVWPAWPSTIVHGNAGFSRALEATLGVAPSAATQQLLLGVTKIERTDDALSLRREDNAVLTLDARSVPGKQLLDAIAAGCLCARRKFGDSVADMLSGLSSLTLAGQTISVHRTGPEVIPIAVTQKQDRRYWVKEIRLADMSFDVIDRDERPIIANVNGISVVLEAFALPLDLKEFARRPDKEGQTVFSVGVKSPIPKPIVTFLGLEPILHLKFTEHEEERKRVDTDDSEMAVGAPPCAPVGNRIDARPEQSGAASGAPDVLAAPAVGPTASDPVRAALSAPPAAGLTSPDAASAPPASGSASPAITLPAVP